MNISQVIALIESYLEKAGPPLLVALLQCLLAQLQKQQRMQATAGAKAVDPTLLAKIAADLQAVDAAQTAKVAGEGQLASDAAAQAALTAQTTTDTATDAANLTTLDTALAQLLQDVQQAQPTT